MSCDTCAIMFKIILNYLLKVWNDQFIRFYKIFYYLLIKLIFRFSNKYLYIQSHLLNYRYTQFAIFKYFSLIFLIFIKKYDICIYINIYTKKVRDLHVYSVKIAELSIGRLFRAFVLTIMLTLKFLACGLRFHADCYVNESRITTYNESAIFESSMQNRPINIIQGLAFTLRT